MKPNAEAEKCKEKNIFKFQTQSSYHIIVKSNLPRTPHLYNVHITKLVNVVPIM